MVLLSRKAKINRVKAALPGLLLDFQDNPPPGDNPFDEPSYTGSASRKLGRIVVQRRFLTFAASSVWASAKQRTIADAANAFGVGAVTEGFAGRTLRVGSATLAGERLILEALD